MAEAWLEGPVEGVTPMLMSAAHTFLQVRNEMAMLLIGPSRDQLWQKVGNSAPIGFHALHIVGSTDRLLTYARGEQLSATQMRELSTESQVTDLDASELIARVERAVDAALAQIRATPGEALLTPRYVGRKMLLSTTLGLTNHAAEHALRHAGQIATLRKVLGVQ